MPSAMDELARYALRLTLTQRRWVLRRNETFTFVDADTVRRRMSIDFELPSHAGFEDGRPVLVPLLLLDKLPLRNLDIRDAEGRPVSLLTTEQNADVIVRGLELLLANRLSPEGDAALGSIVRARTVTQGRAAAARALDPRQGPLLGEILGLPARLRQEVLALVNVLDEGFVALVPIPYRAGERQVVKLSYDARLRSRGVNMYLASFGLRGRIEAFGNLVVGHARSYHCEVVPPADTYIADAELSVDRGAGEWTPVATDDHEFRPHLLIASQSSDDRGRLRMVIHAHREGLLFPLWGASALVAVVLWHLQYRIGAVDAQTMAALLLVPFALAAYYVRSQENRYVTVMLRGVRLVAAVPIVAALVVLAPLALGEADAAGVETAAAWSAWASALAAGVLTLALVSPHARVMGAVGGVMLAVLLYGAGALAPILR